MLDRYLEDHGLKHTRQREVIVQTFSKLSDHVSMEDLLRQVREQDPRIGTATLYRTLKLLVASGLATAHRFGDVTVYEPAAARPHHDHLICTSCGRIVEFENEAIEALQDKVARRHGFRVHRHKMELYGECAECVAQTAAKKTKSRD